MAAARNQFQKFTKHPAYSYFDCSEHTGMRLIKLLMDLLKYEDDSIRLNSFQLLFDIYQVLMFIQLVLNCYQNDTERGYHLPKCQMFIYSNRIRLCLWYDGGTWVSPGSKKDTISYTARQCYKRY